MELKPAEGPNRALILAILGLGAFMVLGLILLAVVFYARISGPLPAATVTWTPSVARITETPTATPPAPTPSPTSFYHPTPTPATPTATRFPPTATPTPIPKQAMPQTGLGLGVPLGGLALFGLALVARVLRARHKA
ncbi:MAG: hypothetical protein HY783_01895 [Chloroflexi bacterium]|nr:hypothetical protein [Chloroflexota bacterium]